MNALKEIFRCIFCGRETTDKKSLEPVIDHLPDAFIIIDRRGIVTSANKACCELLGYDKSEIIGQSASLFFVDYQNPGQEQNEIYLGKILDQLVMKGYVNNLEVIFLTKSKKRIPMMFNGAVLRDDKKNITGVLGLARDIREIKRNTEKLNVLRKISLLTLEDKDIAAVMKETGNYIKEFFGVERTTYYIVKDGHLSSVYASGYPEKITLKIPEGIAGYSVTIKNSYYTNDAYSDKYFHRLIDKKSGYKTKNILVCPVLDKSEVIGVVELINKSENFTEQDKKDLEEMVNLAKFVIFDRQKDAKLKELAKFPEENPNIVIRATNDGKILYFNSASKSCMEQFNCNIGDYLPAQLRLPVVETFKDAKSRELEITCHDKIILFHIKPLIGEGYNNIYGIDITERKLAEKLLRESEDKYRRQFEEANDSIFLSDFEGILLDCNIAATRLVERDRAEIIGKHQSFLHPAEAIIDGFSKTFRSHRTGENLDILEDRVITKSGQIKDVAIRASVITLNGKKVIQSIFRDITERKKAEELLRTSESQLANAMQIAQLGSWEYDVASDLFTFNDYVYSIFRTTTDKVGGYTMSSARYAELFLHPDDKVLVGIETKKAIETTDKHFSRQLEHRIIYADGNIGWISVRFFIVKDEHNRTVKTYGVNQDITVLKQAEEEQKKNYEIQSIISSILHLQLEGLSLRNILEEALNKILYPKWLSLENRGAIFLTSDNGKKLILKAQSCLSEAVCTKCKEVKFGECLCGRAALSGKVEFSGCLDERHTVRYEGMAEHGHYCVPIISNGKTLGVINTYLKPGHIRNKKEEEFLSSMASILAGIIERKTVEREREDLYLQLLKSDKLASIGELASGLAHEIGNPLQTILGNTELLLMDAQNEELLAIKNASLHCKKIIAGLLDFSRQREMNFISEDISILIEKTLSLYGKQLELKKIKVVKNYDVLPKMMISRSHIEQVFLNIVTNAQKSMPHGGTLTITTRKTGNGKRETEDGKTGQPSTVSSQFIEISFKDTGIGIPKENLSRLFEPFFTTKKDGTGLGLSVSFGIVKQHGGEIMVFSDGENKGAEFVVKLPAKFSGGGE